MSLPKGTTLAMEIVYDNSAANPRNPSRPPKRVGWGQRSADEMGDLWLQVLTRDARDLATLNAQFRPKVLAEDVIGYEARIRAEPDSAALHDDAALLYLDLGRAADAVRHFEIAAAMKPDSAAAQFNLGTALIAAGRMDEAMARYRRALELRPDYGLAHNNLGGILFKLGRLDEAESHLTDAVRFDADNADARDNLGRLLAERGRTAQAIEQFRGSGQASAGLGGAVRGSGVAPCGSQRRQGAQSVGGAHPCGEGRGTDANDDPIALDVLAAAYAATGDFGRAVAAAERALALTSSADAAVRLSKSGFRYTNRAGRSGFREMRGATVGRPINSRLTPASVGVSLLQIHFASRSYRR